MGAYASKRLGGAMQVHSVFSKAINLMTSGGMVCLVRRDVGGGPLNVVLDIDERTPLDSIGVTPGMIARSSCFELDVGDRVLSVSLRGCTTRAKKARRLGPVGPAQVDANLRELREQILCEGRLAGMGGLLPVLEGRALETKEQPSRAALAALPPLSDLMGRLESSSVDGIPGAALGLIGLGPGLTPAGDDVLAGLMVALVCGASTLGLDAGFVSAANLSICSVVEGRTTLLSKELLTLAARGEGSEPLLALARAVMSGDPGQTRAAARRELNVGATSGTDAALGVYLGSRAATHIARGDRR
jgi:hypothetical protein